MAPMLSVTTSSQPLHRLCLIQYYDPSHHIFYFFYFDYLLLKDLRRKIDALKENILSCQNEIDEKAEAAANIEQQIDKLEVK